MLLHKRLELAPLGLATAVVQSAAAARKLHKHLLSLLQFVEVQCKLGVAAAHLGKKERGSAS